MKLWMLALVGALTLTLSGCGTLIDSKPASCSGYSKRPLNRSLWDWDNSGKQPAMNTPTKVQKAAQDGSGVRTAQWRIADSYKVCG